MTKTAFTIFICYLMVTMINCELLNLIKSTKKFPNEDEILLNDLCDRLSERYEYINVSLMHLCKYITKRSKFVNLPPFPPPGFIGSRGRRSRISNDLLRLTPEEN